MPHDFPPWQTVYGYLRAWRDAGCGRLGAGRGKVARVREVIADAGLTRRFIDRVRRARGWTVATTHNAPQGFNIHPRRWVVERILAWCGKYRRLGKDFEFMTETSEAMIYAAMIHLLIHLMIRRLHPAP